MPHICTNKNTNKHTMNNFLNNHIVFRFETESDRTTCIQFLRDTLITVENRINRYTAQGYTTESSKALREANQMHKALRKSLSTVFYRTSVVK